MEAWLLDWEERRRPTLAQEPAGLLDDTFSQEFFEPGIAFLPTSRPWALRAYVDYWGAGYTYGPQIGQVGHELLTVAMRDWYVRFGAVPWAATGVGARSTARRVLGAVRQTVARARSSSTVLRAGYEERCIEAGGALAGRPPG